MSSALALCSRSQVLCERFVTTAAAMPPLYQADCWTFRFFNWTDKNVLLQKQPSGHIAEMLNIRSFEESHSEKVPRKSHPFGGSICNTSLHWRLRQQRFWRVSSVLHGCLQLSTSIPLLSCFASELSRTSVGRTCPGLSGFTGGNITLVTVLLCPLPFSFCLSGWCPVSQMGIFKWNSAFLLFFSLGLWVWIFCVSCLSYAVFKELCKLSVCL